MGEAVQVFFVEDMQDSQVLSLGKERMQEKRAARTEMSLSGARAQALPGKMPGHLMPPGK